ncbi:MAG: DUF4115 domain-containing protein [Alphaproteobacteria bacterium]|nr:DUF4115 domain-containing protein [Alphaproteobacteria bacterium]MCD8563210.1 DUF4115 domain-containing protein [Alphaproteobacteria bacterium]
MSASKPSKHEDTAKQKKESPPEGVHPSGKGQEYHTNMQVGEVLRRAREHFGQSLADVEDAIRIRASQIEAIEKSQYEKLPGRVYAIGFVRSYSEYLGFDGDKMVALFKSQSAGGGRIKPELNFPVPASESRLPPVMVVVSGIILFVAFMVFWASGDNINMEKVTEIPSVSADVSSETSEPAPVAPPAKDADDSSVAQTGASGVDSPATTTMTGSNEADSNAVSSSVIPLKAGVTPEEAQVSASDNQVVTDDEDVVPPPEAVDEEGAQDVAPTDNATQAEPVPAAEPVAPQPEANAAAPASPPPQEGITLNVKESSWVEIKDESGKAIVSRMLKTGDQYFVPNRPDLKMSLGNAGGIEITMDGKVLPPLGKKGEVRRNISLDINVLKALAAGQE